MKKAYSSAVWHMAEAIWESVIHNNIGALSWDQLNVNNGIQLKYLELASETLEKANAVNIKSRKSKEEQEMKKDQIKALTLYITEHCWMKSSFEGPSPAFHIELTTLFDGIVKFFPEITSIELGKYMEEGFTAKFTEKANA